MGFAHTGISSEMRYINNTVVDIDIHMPTEDCHSGAPGESSLLRGNLIKGGYYDNAPPICT